MSPPERGRLLILCPFPQGVAAGQRFKYEQYIDDWRADGWEVTVSSYMDRRLWDVAYARGRLMAKLLGTLRGHLRRLRILPSVHGYDLVYVFQWVTPFGTSLLERATRALSPRLVYDVEDNILDARPPEGGETANRLARVLKRTGKAPYLVRAADAVVVASPGLLAPCRALDPHADVRCIPPSLDVDRIRPAEPAADGAAAAGGPTVIGWTGTFSSQPYLDLLSGVLQRLAARVPFVLRVIGNFHYALPGVAVDNVRWTARREAADLQSLDIGLYPLPDDAWTRGKAGLKIIQYQAAGLPCVASDVPLSREQLHHGVTGFLAASDEAWLWQLERLVRDPALRSAIGRKARAAAVARYSHAAIAPAYRHVLADVRARPPR